MTRRWLARALVTLAAPALLVPTLTSPAAAQKPPAVPALAQVTKIYPHLEGGTADVTREKVYSIGKGCDDGKPIKGAVSSTATYVAAFDPENTDSLSVTGAEPVVLLAAERLPSPKAAAKYLREGQAEAKKCAKDGGVAAPHSTFTIKAIRFKLAGQHWGYRLTWTTKKATTIMNLLYVRRGALVINAATMSMEGDDAPSVPKTVALTRLALRTAR
ncbi:hypothetical protein [Nocardioides conyzicola]|uniref:Sensor domain-containing protein n=1 Tax=Nocardioides conyzicola TaxID=1651781 RepID=A0ABP8XPY7_9ACTN